MNINAQKVVIKFIKVSPISLRNPFLNMREKTVKKSELSNNLELKLKTVDIQIGNKIKNKKVVKPESINNKEFNNNRVGISINKNDTGLKDSFFITRPLLTIA